MLRVVKIVRDLRFVVDKYEHDGRIPLPVEGKLLLRWEGRPWKASDGLRKILQSLRTSEFSRE